MGAGIRMADVLFRYKISVYIMIRMADKRHTMHSFRVGGAASHYMDGTAMDVLMEYVGWKFACVASRYAEATASATAAGMKKRSRETAFVEADGFLYRCPTSLHVRIQHSGGLAK